jgi:hypothetical protein
VGGFVALMDKETPFFEFNFIIHEISSICNWWLGKMALDNMKHFKDAF